jgi:hypothetical protein
MDGPRHAVLRCGAGDVRQEHPNPRRCRPLDRYPICLRRCEPSNRNSSVVMSNEIISDLHKLGINAVDLPMPGLGPKDETKH